MLLTRDAILELDDLRTETIHVPEWGGDVRVRSMTAAERDAWESSIYQGGRMDLANLRARLVVMCIVDESGNRVFTDADAAVLGRKSAAAVTRVFEAAQRMNALSARDVEEIAKNSAPSPAADFSSGSA